jgi:hypothetical protein
MRNMESMSGSEQSGEIKHGTEVLKAWGMGIAHVNERTDLFDLILNDKIIIVNNETPSELSNNLYNKDDFLNLFGLEEKIIS